ncbi:MAG TPA: ABC transporter permease [Chloroflexota bacterium]|jgi:peptide/nickel transport system permease protein|nr:ABC transporter permease [Chloroflexota bacterium]
MAQYLLRRTLIAIPTLLIISVVVYTILALAPGDPLSQFAANPDVPAEVKANIRKQFGLDDPVHIRYVKWLTAFTQGDWGWSFASRMPVLSLIAQRIPTTLIVIGTAYLVAVLIAIPLGVLSAVRQYSWFDQVVTTLSFVGFSLPTFFTGLLLILLFSVQLGWLPMVYSQTETDPIQQIKQMAMPVAVLALFQAATLSRFVRASMLDNLTQDYARTARAKGLPEGIVVLRHVLRNALFPVVTLIALQLPQVFTGAVVTEQIFRVPGMGALLIKAIQDNDTPVVMGIVLLFAILVVVSTLVADAVYGLLDPRVRYS